MPAELDAIYPLPRFFFRVTWEGAEIAFSEVTGLHVDADLIEYRHGNSKEFHKVKMPGMQKFVPVVFKRGVFKNRNDFYDWWNTISLNKVVRRTIVVTLQDENDKPIVTWNIKNAWPTKVTSPDLKSDVSEVAVESIDVVHEGITIQRNS
jgi:phage tail-like protein